MRNKKRQQEKMNAKINEKKNAKMRDLLKEIPDFPLPNPVSLHTIAFAVYHKDWLRKLYSPEKFPRLVCFIEKGKVYLGIKFFEIASADPYYKKVAGENKGSIVVEIRGCPIYFLAIQKNSEIHKMYTTEGSYPVPIDMLNSLVKRYGVYYKHRCGNKGCDTAATYVCSICKKGRYCSKWCQKQDWKNHRLTCSEKRT